MDPFDAVVLSELLCTPSARRILQVRRSSFGDGDQRVLVSLDELAGRVAGSPAELEGEVARARRSARRLLRLAARSGIDALAFGASGYPDALASIPDSPPVLWCQGDTRSFDRPAVAIVGSRAGSSYGCEVAARLGSELSGRGVTVVSGLARGVDAAAHRGALEGGGLTIAVLGSGVDVVYPPEHGLLVRAHRVPGRGRQRVCPWRAASGVQFSTTQSDHQRVVACGRRGRGRQSGAGRSSQPVAPPTRAERSWSFPATCCRAEAAGDTP